MYPGPPRTSDGRITWRSVTGGVLLNAAFLAVMVAASHPVAVGVVTMTGVGLYGLYRVLWRSTLLRRSTVNRTLRLSRREVSLCLQLRIE